MGACHVLRARIAVPAASVALQTGNVVEVNVCGMIAHIVLTASRVAQVRSVVSGPRGRYTAVFLRVHVIEKHGFNRMLGLISQFHRAR